MANKETKHYTYRAPGSPTKGLEFWGQNGVCKVLDLDRAANNESAERVVITMSPGELLKRAISIRMGCTDQYPDEVRAVRRLLEEATLVAKQTKAMGSPYDPKALEDAAKHKSKSSILMPGDRMPGEHNVPQTIRQRDAKTTLTDGVSMGPSIITSGAMPKRRGRKKSRVR